MQTIIKKRTNDFSLNDILMLLLIFLAAMNFQAKFFYIVFLSFVLYCFANKKIYCSKILYLYVVFCLVYALFALDLGVFFMLRPFAFALFYAVGYGISYIKPRESIESWIRYSISALSFGSFFHVILNFILNARSNIGRNILDVWSKEIMSATGQAALSCLSIGLCIAWFIFPAKKIERYIAILMLSIIFLFNLILAGRTVYLIFCICLFVCLWFTFKNTKERSRKQSVVLAIISMSIIIFVAYYFDIYGIRTTINNSNFIMRFKNASNFSEWTVDTRMDNKSKYLMNLHKYLFGGNNMKNQWGYAHDLILDAYDYGGVFLTIPLIGIVISSLKSCYIFLKSSLVSLHSKILVLALFTAIGVEFFMEPIFAGMSWIFACFAFIHGTVSAVNNRGLQ